MKKDPAPSAVVHNPLRHVNNGNTFGFFAQVGVGRVTVGMPKLWGYTPADGNLKLLDDFAVVIV